MKSLNSLYAFNARQEGIRNFGEGFLVTIAGPGTGKTYGLIMRVERLVDEETDEKNIVYLTFIHEIVDKFSQDLESYFNKKSKGIPNIGINTLHSIRV
jgi:superfamily I DNA/RNA helicase